MYTFARTLMMEVPNIRFISAETRGPGGACEGAEARVDESAKDTRPSEREFFSCAYVLSIRSQGAVVRWAME